MREKIHIKKITLILLFLCFGVSSFAQLNTEKLTANGRNAMYFNDYVLAIQYFNQVIRVKPFLSEPYLLRAIAKILLEDYSGAVTDASEAISINPFTPQAYYTRAYAQKKLAQYPQAAADLSQAIYYSPQNAAYLANRVEVYVQMEQYEKALEDIKQLANKKGIEVLPLGLETARIYMLMNDTANVQKTLTDLTQTVPENSESWGGLALVHLQLGNDAEALNCYNEAINRGSKNSSHYINRGILNYRVHNYRTALSDYNKAVEYETGEDVIAFFNRGLLRVEVGDYNNAISDFSEVLKREPTHSEALFERANTALRIKDTKTAIADYSQLIEQHPTFIPAYWGRAEAYSLLKNEKAAFKDRMTAKNIEDNKGKYHEKKEKTQVKTNETKNYTQEFNLSVAQGLHKNTEKTVYKNEYRGTIQDKYFDIIPENNFYVSYFSAEPDVRKRIYDHSLLDKLPNLKLCNSDLSLAENQVEQLFSVIHTNNEQIQAEPSAAKLYYFRGIAYSLLQDFDSALNDFNAAVKLDPNFTLAYFSRAVIRYKNMLVNRNECELNAGDSQKPVSEKDEVTLIIADYQKAIELQKDFYFAWFNLGNTYLQAKDFKQAIQCYHISIQYSPDFAEAYFNRGLTYVFIGENKKGITDLSKSGELGIYQSYNFIKRFNK